MKGYNNPDDGPLEEGEDIGPCVGYATITSVSSNGKSAVTIETSLRLWEIYPCEAIYVGRDYARMIFGEETYEIPVTVSLL